MRKYSTEKIQETLDKFAPYGKALQMMALLDDGWEPNQVIKFVTDTNWGLEIPLTEFVAPKIKIKKVSVTRRKYETVKCPYCKVRSKPGPLQRHIISRHPDKLLISSQ